ncbi:PipA/GogA/GtgA family type III secretion system effector [Burkholderia sp. Nafp2/4-1b]|uniref:PipA/GogA/GtgA family type III secretion system effector n=1 Tax=Burkholderia sp. Nafp2/4-1b TaxID=2116686 RepID=UPI0013CF070F|nr:PipA/GogA/GtgA family type III secretion system effector [Burkholderia sp. Nafp2/4-1b]
MRALDYHRNNAHSQRVLDAMQADSAVRLALDKMAPDTTKRHKGDLMKLFADNSNPRCVEAVRQVIVDAYETKVVFRRWANARLDQLIQNPEKRAAAKLRAGATYGTTVTPRQIEAAGGVVIQVVLDEHDQLAPVNVGCADETSGASAFIHEFYHDATAQAHEDEAVQEVIAQVCSEEGGHADKQTQTRRADTVEQFENLTQGDGPDPEPLQERDYSELDPERLLEGVGIDSSLRDALALAGRMCDEEKIAFGRELKLIEAPEEDASPEEVQQFEQDLLGMVNRLCERGKLDDEYQWLPDVTSALYRALDATTKPSAELRRSAEWLFDCQGKVEREIEADKKTAQWEAETAHFIAVGNHANARVQNELVERRRENCLWADKKKEIEDNEAGDRTQRNRVAQGPTPGPDFWMFRKQALNVTTTYAVQEMKGTTNEWQIPSGGSTGKGGVGVPARKPEGTGTLDGPPKIVSTFQITEVVYYTPNYGDTKEQTLARAMEFVSPVGPGTSVQFKPEMIISTKDGRHTWTKGKSYETKAVHTDFAPLPALEFGGTPRVGLTYTPTPDLTEKLQRHLDTTSKQSVTTEPPAAEVIQERTIVKHSAGQLLETASVNLSSALSKILDENRSSPLTKPSLPLSTERGSDQSKREFIQSVQKELAALRPRTRLDDLANQMAENQRTIIAFPLHHEDPPPPPSGSVQSRQAGLNVSVPSAFLQAGTGNAPTDVMMAPTSSTLEAGSVALVSAETRARPNLSKAPLNSMQANRTAPMISWASTTTAVPASGSQMESVPAQENPLQHDDSCSLDAGVRLAIPEREVSVNGRRVVVKSSCLHSASTKAIVFCHGRLQIHKYFINKANIKIPGEVKVFHYIRHNETMRSRRAFEIYYALQYGNNISPEKEYFGSRLVKNYTLRPDKNSSGLRVPDGGRFDLIQPIEIMQTEDIFDAIENGVLPYEEVHFISCRATMPF